jgi:hypothetical protein
MNWAIWLGIFFGAVSVGFLYYGTSLGNLRSNQDTAETVRTEVNKVLQRIDTVKESVAVHPSGVSGKTLVGTPVPEPASQRQAQRELDDIDRNFSTWASNFIKDRDLKKLTLERQQLDARAAEIELSKKYRPIFQRMIDAIRAAIAAYNAETRSDFKTDLHDLPSNLYVSRPEFDLGTVTFTPDTKWTVSFFTEKPASADRSPYFQIDIQGSGQSPDQLRVFLSPSDLRIATIGGGIMSAAKLSQTYPTASANESAETIVRQLIETQISSLPNQ